MSVPTNTVQTYDDTTMREDLHDVVSDVSPTDTPFVSSCGEDTASATFKEWPQDKLRAAAANSQIEGIDKTATARAPRLRPGNFLNISDEPVTVSDSERAIDSAGVDDELRYQVVRAGLEVMNDMELMATGEQAAAAGADGTARECAGAEAWIFSNVEAGVGGSTADWTAAAPFYPEAAPTDGTPAALTNVNWKSVLQQIWTAGGKPTYALGNGGVRGRMSELSGVATLRTETNGQQGTIVGAADIYVSDWSPEGIRLQADRFMRTSVALIIDPDYWSLAYLRRMQEQDLAKTGDADKRNVICEWTLMAKNQESSGKIADIDPAAAVT